MKKEKFRFGSGSSIHQVNWVFVSIFIIAVLFSMGIWLGSYLLNRHYMRNTDGLYQTSDIKKSLSDCDSAMQEYLKTGNRASLVRYNENVSSFEEKLRKLEKECFSAQERSLIRSIRDAFYSYQSSSNFAAFSYYENEKVRCYESLQKARKISAYLKEYCDSLQEFQIQTSYQNEQVFTRTQNRILFLELFSMLLLGGMSALGIFTLVDGFEKPLKQLYRAALAVSGGSYDVAISEKCQDPAMGLLAGTFNQMTESIRRMIEKLEEKKQVETKLLQEQLKNAQYERLLEQANFLALQSQANPHFLFNTLNSISRTVTLERNDDAVKMIDALAGLLRYNLQDAGTAASLAEELSTIAKYLEIQQYRFQDRIHVRFDYDEAYAACIKVPRFTLQPIVENAVIHGLEPKLTQGTIWISVKKGQKECEILIEDDGVGISEKKMKKLLEGRAEGRVGHTTSIGIHNTMHRLEIFTHRRDSFAIENRADGGTVVHIRVPERDEREGGT